MEKVIFLGICCSVIAGCGNSSTPSLSAQYASQSNASVMTPVSSMTEGIKNGWGPERSLFTMDNPADFPIFNAITDNPTIGDERNFVRIGEITPEVTDLQDSVTVQSGKRYLVYIYYHNNASATFNDDAHENAGVATGTRISVSFPGKISSEKSENVMASITSDNSNPKTVWDSALITTLNREISLSYVEGSAKIYNSQKTNGLVLPSSLFSAEGTLIGCEGLDGIIPGCEEYHGTVSFVLEAR